ncbi:MULTISPECIES: efflux RND transporter permease subunit [Methylomonas]|uniref:Acriflavine resistance protein B n=2 Tax=Methylomonas TaxID=416 RepID=A0A126T6X5_9GAMM|nr:MULTISPECIES: efflux RND transporter permease subunit [Methylomonas]AMK77832.1 acriflavine resistance protein B [Methylomonas denitrificans]OAI00944.1 acriflavine resistance protein B [Methylomonas methanica]TCV87002.1 multidrug efflux pump subunit AcrB [Methylomonas methanica]
MSSPVEPKKDSLTVAIVRLFTTSHLSLLFLLISLVAGAAALTLTPREEDPQIVVPVMDVFVQVPGASSEEVEKQVTTPLEVLLRQIKGVEYVYSISRPGEAVVTVRFFVGENLESSLIKTRDKLLANQDIIPPGVSDWLVKPVEIDDVPILLMSLSPQDPQMDAMGLRRVADELIERLRAVDNVGKSWVLGATPRRISVYPGPAKLQAGGISLPEIKQALAQNNFNLQVGNLTEHDRDIVLEAGPYYQTAEQVGATVLKSIDGRLLYLRDVAEVLDGSADTDYYTRIGFGPAVAQMHAVGGEPAKLPIAGEERPMATIAIAKRRGANAVSVAEQVLALTEQLKGSLIPDDVLLTVTRNYGETADHKVNELVMHLSIAILTIIVLLALSLGFKESLIVSLAVPMTFAITLLCDLIFGYTINRVTLFALILSLGLLVDDPIVDVENIHRHYKLRKEPPLQALLSAVNEIRPPTILATFAVIMSFVPMFFITGMMGPYMAPMAFNVPIAMLMSLVIAFTVTPWASYKLLKGDYGKDHGPAFDLKQTRGFKVYQAILAPLLISKSKAWWFLGAVIVAFVLSALMAVTRIVPLKLLPFDNKNELQLVIDMPRGSSLEATDRVAAALGRYLATVNEVSSYQSYVGLASPMDFNGMVRHYYLRQGAHVGDIRIVLADKTRREQGSHEIALRMRPDIERIEKQYGANIKIVEMPPGPPVLSTLVAEVYGPPEAAYGDIIKVANRVRADIEHTEGVVDVDDFVEAEHDKLHFVIEHDKAALLGVTSAQVADTLRLAIAGGNAGLLHIPEERQPLEIKLQLPRAARSSADDLLALSVKTANGNLVHLSEIGHFDYEHGQQAIYHKNLQRVAYVTGEMAGRSPVEAILDLFDVFDAKSLPTGYSAEMAGEGEWKITVDVFRDLGLAFAAAMVMIYILLVGQTGSLGVPLIMMIAIPLTVIGIMPGFWFINLFASDVGAYASPIYFTATAMIGMIALAGIVVRNSIILIDFIENIYRGDPDISLADAIIEAGATRLNPIFLTAASAVLGSMMIVLDPIFSGLAWSFIFGIIASTLFSLVVIPVVYFLINRDMAKVVEVDE